MEAEPTGSNSQGANTTGGANLISFKAVHRIQLSDECIYQAKDEARQLLTLGLLNNEIVTLNAEFQEISKFLHVGNKKINSLRLAEGLVAVAGEDKCVTFYDPRTKTETKKLSCNLGFEQSAESRTRHLHQQTYPGRRMRQGGIVVLRPAQGLQVGRDQRDPLRCCVLH